MRSYDLYVAGTHFYKVVPSRLNYEKFMLFRILNEDDTDIRVSCHRRQPATRDWLELGEEQYFSNIVDAIAWSNDILLFNNFPVIIYRHRVICTFDQDDPIMLDERYTLMMVSS